MPLGDVLLQGELQVIQPDDGSVRKRLQRHGHKMCIRDRSKYEEKEGMQILRDKMATIKWELMEKYSFFKRSDLEEQGSLQKQWDIYVRTLISQVKNYDYAVEDNAEYKDKNESSFEEIFDFMNHINIKKENAFLLNRR